MMINLDPGATSVLSQQAAACQHELSAHIAPVTYGWGAALAELNDVYRNTRFDNWDGEGAKAVSFATYHEADRFIREIRPFYPMPDVDASGQGTLLLSWHAGPRQRMTVSFDGAGRLAYAALVGQDRRKGSVAFSGVVPEEIVRLIGQLAV